MSTVYVLNRVNFPGRYVIGNPEQSSTCGRGKENEIVCASMHVSRQHCIFIIHSDGLYIRDLNSSNGVFINGEKKRTNTKLNQNDRIGIGCPELDPRDPNSFVYTLQIEINGINGGQQNGNAVMPPILEPVRSNNNVSSHQEDKKINEKKRPAEINGSIPSKKQKTEEPCSNGIDYNVKRTSDPVPSTSSASSVPMNKIPIKPDPDDEIQIITEIITPGNKSAGNNIEPSWRRTNNSKKAEPGPSEVTSKPNEKRSGISSKGKCESSEIRTEIYSKPNEKRTEISNKTDEKRSIISSKAKCESSEINTEIYSKTNEKRTEISNKTDDKRTNASNSDKKHTEILNKHSISTLETSNQKSKGRTENNNTTASVNKTIKECKVAIRSIETINRNDFYNLPCHKDNNSNGSSNNKTEKNPSRDLKVTSCQNKSQDLELKSKLNHTVPKSKSSSSKLSENTENHSGSTNKNVNKENFQNGHLTNGFVHSTINNIKVKEEPPDININNNMDKKVEVSSVDNLQKKVNTSKKNIMNLNDLSDDDCKCVNEIINNGHVNYLDSPMEELSKSKESKESKPSTSNSLESKTVKEEPKIVKEEQKTSYSEVDVVCLSSDDEDDEYAFPCSQLFSSVNDEPVIKQEPLEESENQVRGPQDDVIVLSDSDEEDLNPWFNRLFNSQVYRPSQDNFMKTEPEEENNETIEDEGLGLESLFLGDEENHEIPGTSKENQIPETDEKDDDVWNENIQSQETAAKEAKFIEKQTSSKLLEESKNKISKSTLEKSRRSRTEQHSKKKRKIVISSDEDDDKNSTRESSSFEKVRQSIQAFDDFRARRKDSEDKRKVQSHQEKEKYGDLSNKRELLEYEKEKQDDSKYRKERHDERRKKSSMHKITDEGRDRRKSSADNREWRRDFDESREREKIKDIREKKREREKSRDRRNDHENKRERNKENEEKLVQVMKKRKEEEEHQIKKKDLVQDRNRSSENDRKKISDYEKNKNFEESWEKKDSNDKSYKNKISLDNETEKKKLVDEIPRRFFENGLSKIKNVEIKIKKLDEKFGRFSLRQTSKSTENITENLKPLVELPQTSKLPESGTKKPKSWENELQTIDERNLAIKSKLSLRRTPIMIDPPPMPKGEKRGISVSVYKNNNDYPENLLSKEDEMQNTVQKFERKKNLTTVKTIRKRSRSMSRTSCRYFSRGINGRADSKMKKEIRKEKLKQISANKPILEETTTIASERRKGKAIVKNTSTSRQDTLLFEQQKTAAIKPGIAHQRMNTIQPIAHCSKSTTELIKVQKDKSQKSETESNRKEGISNFIFDELEQEQILRDLVFSESESVSSEGMEIDFNKKNESIHSKSVDITSKTNGIRKSCLASVSFNGYGKRPDRKVHWNDARNEIRIFEIEEKNSLRRVVGKDAPINRPKPQYESKIDEYLSRIFNWNPSWLEEQKKLPHEPPVYRGDQLRAMKKHYASVTDYCNILRPLLLLEIWNSLTKESECDEKKHKYRMRYCSVVQNSISKAKTSGGDAQTNFMLEVVITRDDFKKELYPGPGHLIILEFSNNGEVSESNERVSRKSTFRRIFAYVESKCQATITPTTRLNRELMNATREAEMLLTFSILTKQAIEPPTGKICRMRGVMYLKSNMREMLALQHFPTSPLQRLILTPTIEDYQMPEIYAKDYNSLVTKDTLNEKQLEAVMRISKAVLSDDPRISLIHGPPGTGKSKVVVNIVTQILTNGSNAQILLCAPSNAAVDELVLRLLQIRSNLNLKNIKMVRVGRLDAMNPKVKNVSLTELGRKQVEMDFSFTAKEEKILKANEAELEKLENLMNLVDERIANVRRRGINGNIEQLYKQRKNLQNKIRELKAKNINRVDIKKLSPAEINRIHRDTEELMLSKASVIACTLSSCYSGMMEKLFGGKNGIKIPICIVDEATQSCETENLIPLMLGVKKLILVGDTNQLPATVLSKKAKEMGLDQSLFARVQKTFENLNESPIIMLNTQYRMDYPILAWPNSYFYKGKLIHKAKVKEVPYSSYRILNLNSNQDEGKFSNTNEADFVSKIIYIMVACVDVISFKEPLKVGVITPYQSQRSVILSKIERRLETVSSEKKNKFIIEVNTVDSFQGQERDVIIMSCVRSNGIGFMSDRQRLCVALTRAKSSLILCGNFKTFQKDEMWNELLADAKNRNIFIDVDDNANLDEIKSHVLR